MKKSPLLLLLLFILFASTDISVGAEIRTLEIDFAFSPPADLAPQLGGYRLFKNGQQVCETTVPATAKITCDFLTEAGTFDFTLQAFYTNGTASPLSPSFPFTITTPPDLQTVTFNWEYTNDSTNVGGFRLYYNGNLLYEITQSSSRQLTLEVDMSAPTQTFTMTAVDATGLETPLAKPPTYTIGTGTSVGGEMRTLEIDFSFTPPADLAQQLLGYRLFKNGQQVCETHVPTTAKITCGFLTEAGTFDFALQAFYADGTASPLSPAFPFTITTPPDLQNVTFNWEYTDDSTNVGGFRLYSNGNLLYEITQSSARQLTLAVDMSAPTQTFTMTAVDANGLETPLTKPPTYNIGTGTSVSGEMRTLEIDFAFTPPADLAQQLLGYRLFKNGQQVCETPVPTTAKITCDFLTEAGTFDFTLQAFYANGTASPLSPSFPFTITALSGIQNITFNWEYADSNTNIGGFRLYDNGILLSTITQSSARQLTLAVDMSAPTHTFTMTAVDATGLETPLAKPPTYTVDTGSTGGTGPLTAVISPTPSTGPVPLNVSFAGTGSTGDIASWYWEFGDGTTGSGSVAGHTYTFAGTYTATLQVTDQSGATQQATASITVQPSASTSAGPTAILSSSTAAGNAPLNVSFDGSSSTTPNPPITAYQWAFGDGSTATGVTTSHIYTTAGTYYAELTVVDSKGLTGKVNTPVIVIGSTTINNNPAAVIAATPTQGTSPMIVSFDGSQSVDSDGSIVTYSWNFGDGTTGTGKTAQHTYTSNAVFTVSLQVTDDKGAMGTTSRQVTCSTALPAVAFTFEVGDVSITREWGQVLFGKTFNQPVVIVGPPAVNEAEPVVVRVRNVTPQGFEIRLQEWPYQDGSHAAETVSYLAVEKGRTSLTDGTKVEAGVLTSGTLEEALAFQQAFTATPVVLTTINSEKETDAVTGRTSKISNKVFSFKLQEQEASDGKHINETIAYLALEPNKGKEGDLLYETAITTGGISQNWSTIVLQNSFAAVPFFFANMQTQNEQDPAAIRQQQLSKTAVSIRIEEETSLDAETSHGNETVGYLALGALTTVIDEQTVQDSNTATTSVSKAHGQGIYLLNSGSVNSILLKTGPTKLGSPPAKIRIGTTKDLSKSYLAESTEVIMNSTNTEYEFIFSSPVTLQAKTQYYFAVSITNDLKTNYIDFMKSSTNAYAPAGCPDCNRYYKGTKKWNISGSVYQDDLYFKIVQ